MVHFNWWLLNDNYNEYPRIYHNTFYSSLFTTACFSREANYEIKSQFCLHVWADRSVLHLFVFGNFTCVGFFGRQPERAMCGFRQWIVNRRICAFESGQPLERAIEGTYLVCSILAINLAAPSITNSLIECMSSLIGSQDRRWYIDNLSITFLVQLNQTIRLCEVFF